MAAALLYAALLLQEPALADAKTGKPIQVGDRIQITVRTDYTVRGIAVKPAGAPKEFDPSKQAKVILDLTLDHDRLNGTVTVERQNIQSIEILPPLSKDQREQILQRKALALARLTDEDKKRMEDQDHRFKEWEKARLEALTGKTGGEEKGKEKDAAGDDEARKMYAEFPEAEGWAAEKMEELKRFLLPTFVEDPPYLDSRKPIPQPGGVGTTFAPADPKEAKFLKNYDLWLRGRELATKESKPKPEEEKKAGEEKEKTGP